MEILVVIIGEGPDTKEVKTFRNLEQGYEYAFYKQSSCVDRATVNDALRHSRRWEDRFSDLIFYTENIKLTCWVEVHVADLE